METHLANGAICFKEVWLQVCIEQVARQTFDGVINGEDMHPLAVLHISTLQKQDLRYQVSVML